MLSNITIPTVVRHVRNSNLIERIVASRGERLFDQHAEAVVLVAREGIVHPRHIHQVLLRNILPSAGEYRKREVDVDKRPMPRCEKVPALMEEWCRTYELALSQPSTMGERNAWVLHDWFLCIHPFRDGNGREARLLFNMFRLHMGLPWHVIQAKNKWRYYAHIRHFEDHFFRSYYQDCY